VSKPKTYVTTSWDDGHELDVPLASELAAHGLTGTFYVAPQCRGIPAKHRLTKDALVELADGFEIGGHTLTHPHLSQIAPADARREITDGKVALEDQIGRPVTSFCYPYGDYGNEHPEIVREAGFTLARTVDRFCTTTPNDFFQMGTTTHAYRHLVDGPEIIRRARSVRHAAGMWRNWELLGRQLLEETCAKGGVFHLWGHSWEVDANDDWFRLRKILEEISSVDACFVTNGELVAALRETT